MNSAKYWEDRRKKLEEQLEKDEKKLMDNLSKDYARSIKELEKDIAYYYKEYGRDNIIEYRSLLQKLSQEDRQLLYVNMDAFALKYPEYAHLMPIRESIYQLNRLEGLKQEIYIKQCELGIITERKLTNHLKNLAKKSYKVAGGKNTYNHSALEKLVNRKWVGSDTFSSRIWKNMDKLTNTLTNEFQNAIIRGDNYEKCIQILRKRFDVSHKEAHRLVYTEGTFIMNEASMTAFEEEYEFYEYSALMDSRTTPICKSLNGKKFKISERQAGVNFPPMHPLCRSSYLIVLDAEDKKDKTINKKHSNQEIVRRGFVDVTDEWKIVPENKRKPVIKRDKAFLLDGVKYIVDGKHVLFEPSENEYRVAELISRYGRAVALLPRVLKPQNIKTPDYYIDGIKTDLKTIKSTGANVFYNLTKNKKEQAECFIFDISAVDVNNEWIDKQIKNMFESAHRKWIKKIIIIENENLKVYVRE